MPTRNLSNLILGLCIIGFALILLFVWIPLDTQSGMIERVRRQVVIGDALAPSVAAGFLLIGGLLLVLFERDDPNQPRLMAKPLLFLLSAMGIIGLSLLVMRYAGPTAVMLTNLGLDEPREYRLLRDAAPWKYIGFFLGGTGLIAGLIALVEGRFRTRAVIIAVLAVVAMIVIYDVPFDDLLLPPNGDV